jgi:hypothetical protein
MALAQPQTRPQQTYLAQQGMGRGGPSGLAEVLDVLLDKGLVIDAFVRVSVVGIELLTIDARVVIASVDTYLRFAEAVNRLDLLQVSNAQSLGDLTGGKSSALSGGRDDKAFEERKHTTEDDGREEPGDDTDSSSGAPDDTGSERSEATNGTSDDDKGILTRIKERGQVF